MAISVCGLNIRLVMESVTRKGRGACMSLRNSMTFFYGRGRMGAKAWSKATPERRELHRQGCRAAAGETETATIQPGPGVTAGLFLYRGTNVLPELGYQ